MANQNLLNFRIAHHKALLWFVASIITLGSAVYQRVTGPTYPVRGKINIGTNTISFKLLRSEIVSKKAAIILDVPDTTISGYVQFRRYKSYDDWTIVPFQRLNHKLVAYLPHQPPAGKLLYFVWLENGNRKVSLTGKKPVILRYKGAVPAAILIPHVLLMFLAMLFSNRTALEALDTRGNPHKYILWTIGLFFIGGLILGSLVQKYAFGQFWTGIPLGYDLTDNKTLLVTLGWIWAWIKNRDRKNGRGWILLAAVLTLLVYLIPHSLLGSELDYTKLHPSPSDGSCYRMP